MSIEDYLQKLGEAEVRRRLEHTEQEQGPCEPDTLRLVHRLAQILESLDRLDEAKELLWRAFEGRQSELGDEHPDTLASLDALAHLLVIGLGEIDEAEDLYRQAINTRQRVLGLYHPDTLRDVHALACVVEDFDLDEAKQLFWRAAAGRERELGREHPDTLASFAMLIGVLRQLGEDEEAKALSVRDEMPGRLTATDVPLPPSSGPAETQPHRPNGPDVSATPRSQERRVRSVEPATCEAETLANVIELLMPYRERLALARRLHARGASLAITPAYLASQLHEKHDIRVSVRKIVDSLSHKQVFVRLSGFAWKGIGRRYVVSGSPTDPYILQQHTGAPPPKWTVS